MSSAYDLAVVGAGIVGLAHARAAALKGKRVIVIDRDTRANGASVRNFGFVTVTGQRAGDHWRRALRSRDIWAEVAPKAGIPILQRGLAVLARRPKARAVLEAFCATEMGAACTLMHTQAAADRFPQVRPETLDAAMWSPHELRVESRDALSRLAAWLEGAMGVAFRWGAQVTGVEPPAIETTAGRIEAETVVVCPNDELRTLFPERIAGYGLRRCVLQMLRVMPQAEGFTLPSPIMSDLSMVRYDGYAALAPAARLRKQLEAEQAEHLAKGIHLIAVQSADGSLVVGDSHVYGTDGASPSDFRSERVDELILDELQTATGIGPVQVMERWTGTYPVAGDDRVVLVDTPAEAVRLVMVTGGTGASTAFALGEEVIDGLFGSQATQPMEASL